MTEYWFNVYETEPGRHEIGIRCLDRDEAARFVAIGFRLVYRIRVRLKVRG